MRHAWVVGAGGLLGSALVRSLAADPAIRLHRAPRIDWDDSAASSRQLGEATREWFSGPDNEYELYWCAGAGVTSTAADRLQIELRVFETFISRLAETAAAAGRSARLRVFLASSVGGLYSGSMSPPFDENSVVAPISPYGATKAAAEQALRAAAAAAGFRAVVGRLTTLYGPGQRLDKPQGFIGHLCRSYFARQPLHVYVPIDTQRDYLHADDAAALVRATVERVSSLSPGETATKILASHAPVTIGSLLRDAQLVFKRRPSVVLSVSPHAVGQVLDLRARSLVWPDIDARPSRSLAVGLMQTRTAMEIAFRSKG